MATDAQSIIDEILTDLNLDTTSPKFITRAHVLAKLNKAIKFLYRTTSIFTKLDTSSITWATGTRSYSLPTDCYDILGIYDPVEDHPVIPITISMLNDYKADWYEDSGEIFYYFRGYEGMDKISFYKKPSSSYNGESPHLWYKHKPAALTDASNSYLPAPIADEDEVVIDYAKAQLFRSRKEIRDIDEADKAWGRFLAFANQIGTDLDKAPNRVYIYGSRRVEYSGPYGPQWPSEYP